MFATWPPTTITACGLVLPDQLAHPPDLQHVRRDAADAHDVVPAVADLLDEAVQGGEVQQRAGGRDVRLDEHQAPGAMEHPQRKRPLHPGHLVVVQLHRVDRPAAVLVVLGVRAEDARQQHLGATPQGMSRGASQVGEFLAAGSSCGFHHLCLAWVTTCSGPISIVAAIQAQEAAVQSTCPGQQAPGRTIAPGRPTAYNHLPVLEWCGTAYLLA